LASLILVVNVVGELQQKRTLAASRGFLAAARLSCKRMSLSLYQLHAAVKYRYRRMLIYPHTNDIGDGRRMPTANEHRRIMCTLKSRSYRRSCVICLL